MEAPSWGLFWSLKALKLRPSSLSFHHAVDERLADCFGKPLGGVCLNNIGASFSLGWFSSVHFSNCGGSHVVMLWQEVVFLVVGQQLDAQHGGPRTPANIPSDFPTSMTQP